MSKQSLVYLTTNIHKVEEANRFLRGKYGFDLQVKDPDFDVLEIQAKSAGEVVRFSAKYAADRLGVPCLKSDTALYIDCLGGLPGPYNAYFDKQIGEEKFLLLIQHETNRTARLEHTFGYCEPMGEPVVFVGGSLGSIAYLCSGTRGRWHDKFFIPDGETRTLSVLREANPDYEATFWGTALTDFAEWYMQKDR